MTGEGWIDAPDVVIESIQQSLSEGVGEGGECVMVKEGELVSADCSVKRHHVCLFIYSGNITACLLIMLLRCYYI